MRKILKGVFAAVISFALTLLTVVAGVFPATISVSAEEGEITYEQTNVMDDLKNSTINGQKFSLYAYGFNAFKETKVLSFVEYCYSFQPNKQDNYGLYVYVYNPKGLQFVGEHPLNQIQMAYGLDASQSYVKYPIKFLNRSTDKNYEGLFYKYKVVLTDEQCRELLNNLNSSDRVYRVSGIELLEAGKTNATEFSVATTYHFRGYAAGYGSDPNAENTLVMDSEQGEVLNLNVRQTVYRPSGTNGKNDYTQDSLHSVYFAVPNDVIARYGGMTRVHARWLNAVLAPTLVTGNRTAYEAFLPLLGKRLEDEEDFKYCYLGAYSVLKSGDAGARFFCGYGYYDSEIIANYEAIVPGRRYGKRVENLYSMYYAGEGTDSADRYTVSSEDILADLKASKSKYGGYLVNGKYSSKMFDSFDREFTEVNIRADETYTLTDQKIDRNWWDKLWGLRGEVTTKTFDGISAIHTVTEEDVQGNATQAAQRLYISESDYADFYDFYQKNKNLCTVYLFRYQVSDYISQEATLLKENMSIFGYSIKKVDTNAYFFQQTVNLDFDIIDVTFSNGITDTVIPAVANPIDVVHDATAPVYTKSDKQPNWFLIIAAVLLVVVLIVLIICFPQAFPAILSGVGKFIAWPFKQLGKLFKKRGKKK